VADGWIREGHGDLRTEHVCLEDSHLQIFDCVEFSRAIRCADVASDLAYLLLDLDRLGAGAVASELVERYRAAAIDLPDELVRFYRIHRALVKVKIDCLEARTCDLGLRPGFLTDAGVFLDLATADALVCRPVLLAMTGLSGTGKSFVAASLARALRADLHSSDAIRRELHGASGSTPAGWQEGIYAPEMTAAIYDRLFALAGESLRAGRPALLDATFLDAERRERLAAVAGAAGVALVLVETACDEATALRRIRARAEAGDSPSEAYDAIYRAQRTRAESRTLPAPANAVLRRLDTSADGPVSLDPVIGALDQRGALGERL
jgi:predicted kinase